MTRIGLDFLGETSDMTRIGLDFLGKTSGMARIGLDFPGETSIMARIGLDFLGETSGMTRIGSGFVGHDLLCSTVSTPGLPVLDAGTVTVCSDVPQNREADCKLGQK